MSNQEPPEQLQPNQEPPERVEEVKVVKPVKAKAAAKSEYDDTYAVLVIEQPDFDPRTGERKSVESTVTYNEGDLRQFGQFGKDFGWVVREIKHIPQHWADFGIDKMLVPFSN